MENLTHEETVEDMVCWNFQRHPPHTQQVAAQLTRQQTNFRNLALDVTATVPEGRERSIAMTKLEESLGWTLAALERNQPPAPADHDVEV